MSLKLKGRHLEFDEELPAFEPAAEEVELPDVAPDFFEPALLAPLPLFAALSWLEEVALLALLPAALDTAELDFFEPVTELAFDESGVEVELPEELEAAEELPALLPAALDAAELDFFESSAELPPLSLSVLLPAALDFLELAALNFEVPPVAMPDELKAAELPALLPAVFDIVELDCFDPAAELTLDEPGVEVEAAEELPALLPAELVTVELDFLEPTAELAFDDSGVELEAAEELPALLPAAFDTAELDFFDPAKLSPPLLLVSLAADDAELLKLLELSPVSFSPIKLISFSDRTNGKSFSSSLSLSMLRR